MDRLVEEKVETLVETKKEEPLKESKKVVLHKEKIEAQTETAKEEKVETQVAEPKVETSAAHEEKIENKESIVKTYISSFENVTIEDLKKREEAVQEEKAEEVLKAEEHEEEKVEPEQVVVNEIAPQKSVKKLVIEKPNYDFIAKDKKGKKEKVKKKPKLKAVFLACALAVSCVGCVAGTVAIDNLSSQYIELQDEYNLNLLTYLKDINNLNATNKGLEFIETYPEDLNEISSIGETTNWFDNLVNFITGLFGG